jgi:ABC-type Fe3+/spermidine/putrescine transport system ATPase subunit
VMNHGRVEQVGTPRELYEEPATAFVADFVGESNTLAGTFLHADAERGEVRLAGGPSVPCRPADLAVGAACTLSLRPERVLLGPPGEGGILRGRVVEAIYAGEVIRYWVEAEGAGRLLAKRPNDRRAAALQPGDSVAIDWHADDCKVFRSTG